jgi:RNA polymerase sigma-70 factor (ECF subfamily)
MFLLFATLASEDPSARIADADEAEVQRLVDAARSGNMQAARRIYQLHATRVFRSVRAMVKGRADAEDIVQDTFGRALTSLDRYQPREGVRFISWLLTIAVNTTKKRARRRRPEPIDPERLDLIREHADATDAPIDPDDAIDRRRLSAALMEALDSIPDRDRTIVTLRYAGELSAKEVADVSGTSEANVRKICERQKRILVERIEGILHEKSIRKEPPREGVSP